MFPMTTFRFPVYVDGQKVAEAVKNVMAKGRDKVAGQASVGDIMDTFYADFATEESGRYWWWCREVLVDPFEIIVEGNHELYRVPFEVTAEGVTFGEPRQVRIEYVDAIGRPEQVAAALDAIASVRGDKVAARFDERPTTRPRQSTTQGGSMDINQLRTILNLSADVPDAEVLRIAAQRLSAQGGGEEGGNVEHEPEPGQEGGGQEGGGGTVESEPEGGENQPEATAGGTVVVDSGALRALQEQAAVGVEERDLRLSTEADRVLDQAVTDGKIPPARRQHWANLMARDREGTLAMLDELADNVIPIHARGEGRAPDGDGGGGSGFGYPEHLLPEVVAKKARVAAGARSRVMTDRG